MNEVNIRYRRPPVVERAASLWAKMDSSVFESRFEDWRQLVEKEFPIYEPLKEWLLQVEAKEGIPLINTLQPEVKVTPRFSKKKGKEGFDWSIRCPLGQFTVNMHSDPQNEVPRRYDDLRQAFSSWLPKWIDHFGVEGFERLRLHYVNRLDRTTIAEFVNRDGSLALDKVISLFVNIPGEQELLVPPFDCQATVVLRDRKDSSMLLRLKDINTGHGPALHLEFVVQSKLSPEEADSGAILRVLDWCHDRVIRRFELVFTPEAKQAFQPMNI